MTNQTSKMGGAQINAQELKPKTCKWAMVSLFCGVFGWGVFILGMLGVFLLALVTELTRPVICKNVNHIISVTILSWLFTTFVLIISALVSGVAGLIIVRRKKDVAKGTGQAVVGILLSAFFLAIPFVIFCFAVVEAHEFSNRASCECNLRGIGVSIEYYAKDNDGNYPTAAMWCDLLVGDPNRRSYILQEWLVCPSGDKGRCHYAMNPNCEPNSPGDIVLLFETKGGWNQFGGPEILTFENHKGSGCNVLFNNGRNEFVRPKEVSKLKWKGE
jgi:uncharacterized Tic20 family protein